MKPPVNILINCKYKNTQRIEQQGTGMFVAMGEQFGIFCIEGNGEVPIKLTNIISYEQVPQPQD